jgi:hypothetical protein
MASATNDPVAELLQEAGETHHRVYRIPDGTDDDWASWYSDWLLMLSELPELLAARPVRSHLVHALVQLDRITTPTRRTSPGRSSTPGTCASGSAAARSPRCPPRSP